MINDCNVNATVSSIMKSVDDIVCGMNEGSRLTTKEIVELVVNETSVPVAIAAGITSLCLKHCENLFQRPGRNGGNFKKTGCNKAVNVADDLV